MFRVCKTLLLALIVMALNLQGPAPCGALLRPVPDTGNPGVVGRDIRTFQRC